MSFQGSPENALPLIAVVIPCFNGEAFIERALRSVIDQGYPHLDVIVVDDGSTDKSVDIISAFGAPIRLQRSNHGGACRARNIGIEASRAEFILFLDADDYLHGDYLLQLGRAAAAADLVVGAYAREESGRVQPPFTLNAQPNGPPLIALYVEYMLQTSALMWRRQFLLAHGGWRESLPIFQDIELGIRMLLQDPIIAYAELQDAYAVWVQHEQIGRITSSMSRHKVEAILAVLREHKSGLVAAGPATARALAWRFHIHACVAFATGYLDVGRDALAECRALRVRVDDGGIAHRLAVKLLGLERKTRLASLSYRLFPRPRPYPHNLTTR